MNRRKLEEKDYNYLCNYIEYKLQEDNKNSKVKIPEYDSQEEILYIQYIVYNSIENKHNLMLRIGQITKNKDQENRLTNLDNILLKGGKKIDFYRGETLNTPLYLIKMLISEKKNYMDNLKSQYDDGKLEGHIELKSFKPGNFSIRALNYFEKHPQNYSDEVFKNKFGIDKIEYVERIKLINEFCRLYSSIGNMIVFIDDKKANINKAGPLASLDTGVQMLMQVEHYFKYNEVKGKFLSAETTKAWIDSYGSFNNFVHAFALEDYVDDTYNVKPLFDGQSIHNLKPNNTDLAKQFLGNVVKITIDRDNRIFDTFNVLSKDQKIDFGR